VKILALIPARGGSKRIPRKNIRPLCGKPLIAWSIDVAMDIPDICDVLVSTDDAAIAKVAQDAGALLPWLRPAELSTDTATSVDVALHALDWYEGEKGDVDGVLLLQPTSPFRSRETIVRGINLFRQHDYRSVVGVSPAASHPMWCFNIEDSALKPYMPGGLHLRSQDLPPAYVINGAFYLLAPSELRRNRSFNADNTQPLIIDGLEESMDIDTEQDWRIAEVICRSLGDQDRYSR